MSPTQKLRIGVIKRAGPKGHVAGPDRVMHSLEAKGYIRSEIDPDRVLSLRYFVTEKVK